MSSGSDQLDRFERRNVLQVLLEEWIPTLPLSQMCVDFCELPLNQLWIFPNDQMKVIRFDPQTSEMQLYSCDQKFTSGPKTFAPRNKTFWIRDGRGGGEVPDFVLSTDSLCGIILEEKIKTKINLKTSLKFSRMGEFLCTFEDQLYCIGLKSSVWSTSNKLKRCPLLDLRHWGSALILYEEHLFRFGGVLYETKEGEDVVELAKTVTVFDFKSQTWTPLPPLTSIRIFSSVAVHPRSKRLFLSGGFNGMSEELHNTIEIFDTKTRQFVKTKHKMQMPKPLWNHFSFCFNDFYFLVGGTSKTKSNEKIWKHRLTSQGKWVGKWHEVVTLPSRHFRNDMLFG